MKQFLPPVNTEKELLLHSFAILDLITFQKSILTFKSDSTTEYSRFILIKVVDQTGEWYAREKQNKDQISNLCHMKGPRKPKSAHI